MKPEDLPCITEMYTQDNPANELNDDAMEEVLDLYYLNPGHEFFTPNRIEVMENWLGNAYSIKNDYELDNEIERIVEDYKNYG